MPISSWKEKFSLWIGKVKAWQSTLTLQRYLLIAGGIILGIGLIATVDLALQNQENRSHASGTITLQVDPKAQVNFSSHTATFFVKLIYTGPTPPITSFFNGNLAVAALKLHLLVKNTSPILSSLGLGNNDVFHVDSFVLHDPHAFPLEGDNPSGIPPFSQAPNPSLTPPVGCYYTMQQCPKYACTFGRPCPTCSPTPRLVCTTPVPTGCHYVYPVCSQAIVGGTPIPCPTPRLVCNGYPTPPIRPTAPQAGGNTVLGARDVSMVIPSEEQQRINISPAPQSNGQNSQDNKGQDTLARQNAAQQGAFASGQDTKHLYYSVGDQYTKTVNTTTTLADLTIKLNIPDITPHIIAQYAQLLHGKNALTIAFAQDTEVYILNPTGDSRNPFVKTPFVHQDAQVTWDDLLGLPTPTPSSCNPIVCPSGQHCELPATIVGGKPFCLVTPTPTPSQISSTNPDATNFQIYILDQNNKGVDGIQMNVSDSQGTPVPLTEKAYTSSKGGQILIPTTIGHTITATLASSLPAGTYASPQTVTSIVYDYMNGGTQGCGELNNSCLVHLQTSPATKFQTYILNHDTGAGIDGVTVSIDDTSPNGNQSTYTKTSQGGGAIIINTFVGDTITMHVTSAAPTNASFAPLTISSLVYDHNSVTKAGCGELDNSCIIFGYGFPSTTSSVTLPMILACIDLNKPTIDPTSNYNSDACKAYPNRADADINHDGWINGVDLNLFYRGGH